VTTVWNEYVVLAGDLARHDSEAWRRSALSRAYYGAFNSARRWAEANVGPIEDRAAHAQVWRIFKNPVRATEGSRRIWLYIGELGDNMRRLRNLADYADDLPDLSRRANEAALGAERILALLPELELAD
jgi:hypothetical protein